jgi:hypothetical protein
MTRSSLARISVPNDFSILQEELVRSGATGETWFCPPDHLSYFNFSSLRAALENSGYNCIKMLADFPIESFLFNHSLLLPQKHLV